MKNSFGWIYLKKKSPQYQLFSIRHGIMLVGPTGGGKTVARTILQKALSLLPIYLDREKNKNLPNTVSSILKPVY